VTATKARLAAEERRAALIDAALRVFASGSYKGATTAAIAGEAGVTEPVLYRHFASKRDLFLVCLEEAWSRLRERWGALIEKEPDPAHWMGRPVGEKSLLVNLWAQALTEASDDREIKRQLRRHLREVHAFVAGFARRAQASGYIPDDRDPEAEAWIFIAIGLLAGQRVIGLTPDELARIGSSRRRWLTGRE
jgi:AcrR family transcriptional regulator